VASRWRREIVHFLFDPSPNELFPVEIATGPESQQILTLIVQVEMAGLHVFLGIFHDRVRLTPI